jgi:hypothetical protein
MSILQQTKQVVHHVELRQYILLNFVQFAKCRSTVTISTATSATHQASNRLFTIKLDMARVLLALTAVAVILLGYVVRSVLKGYAIRSRMHKLVSDGNKHVRSTDSRN